jgi:hypothetical protein
MVNTERRNQESAKHNGISNSQKLESHKMTLDSISLIAWQRTFFGKPPANSIL